MPPAASPEKNLGKKREPIPAYLNIPDAIGLLMFGFGASKMMTDIDFLPQAIIFPGYGPIYAVIGSVLMLPAITYKLYRRHQRKKAAAANGDKA